MISPNDMVRDGGPPMKVAVIDQNGIAECILIDSHGIPRLRFVHVQFLQPMWHSLQPRSLWPETAHFDLFDIEKEERVAAAAKKQRLKAAKKAKRSNKIKRRRPPVSA